MYDRRTPAYVIGSVEFIQILALRAGLVFALFICFNAIMFKAPHWQWALALAALYASCDLLLSRYQASPGATELLFKLCVCAGLTFLQTEYSNILYYLLLIRIALRVGRNRTVRAAAIIGAVYLAAAFLSDKSIDKTAMVDVFYNLVILAFLSYAVIYIDTLVSSQAEDGRQVLDLIKQNDHHYQMALTDALTGLYNHRAYKERIDALPHYVLMVIDIDHFKKLNDTYGHLVGDKVLVTIGDIIKLSIRKGDLAFRYGGEEFVVVLPGTTASIGMKIAERLREKVADWSFEQGVPVTVSIGLTVKKNGMTSQVAFEQADNALYTAKKSGRNNVQPFIKVKPDVTAIK